MNPATWKAYFRRIVGVIGHDHDDNVGVGDNPYFVHRVAVCVGAHAANVVYQGYFNHLSGWTGDHRLASYVNAQARFGLPSRRPTASRPLCRSPRRATTPSPAGR